MSQFRLVILDNVKEQLDNPVAQKLLADMLFAKQKNFLRTDPNYVVMDKHDMIGTHYLIYDTSDFMSPKLIFAIRTTFLERARQHRIETPLMSLVSKMEPHLQAAFQKFHDQHQSLVDCNAWFVDPVFSKKSSGLSLSDLGYFMVCMNVMRAGFDNIVGCTNEKYNASRWLENLGKMEKGFLFKHPAVPDPHLMAMVEQFNLPHFLNVYLKNKALVDDIFEVFPKGATMEMKSLPQFINDLFDLSATQHEGPSAA